MNTVYTAWLPAIRCSGIGACAALLVLFPILVMASAAIVITSPAPPSGIAGSSYSFQFTAAGGSPPYSWSVSGLPPGLSVSPSGLVTGTPLAGSTGSYSITVSVTDGYLGGGAKYTIQIYPPRSPVFIATIALPNGTVGVFYRQTIQAAGGTPPYMFDSFAPPPGLSVSGNGFLTGTPTTAGTYIFTINVADNVGGQASQTYTIIITPPLVITTKSPLMSGSVGTALSQTIMASGGTTPYSFFVTIGVPAGLTMGTDGVLSGTPTVAGTFSFDIRVVDALGVTASGTFQITITPAAAVVQVSPQALFFTAAAGGDAAPPQGISVVSTPNSIVFSIQIDGGAAGTPAPGWLTVKPSGGSTPARLTVTATPGAMLALNNVARIRVIPSGQAPIDVLVSLTVVAAAPQLGVVPNFLRFAARVQVPGTLSQVLVVGNTGGGGPISFSASITGRSPWIHVTPAAGQTTPNSTVFLEVQIDSRGLQLGSHRDAIQIISSAGSINVPVLLFVAGAGPILALGQSGLLVEEGANGTPLASQMVPVFNFGDPGTTINWTARPLSGANAVSFVGSRSGTASTSQPGAAILTANSNVPDGSWALVEFSASNALNSPQYLAVVVNRPPASSRPRFQLDPAGVVLTSNSPRQTVRVYTDSPTPVPFQAATDAPSLISFAPPSGTASASNPGQIVVSANAAGTGSLNVAVGAEVQTVNITSIVPPPGTTPASEIRAAAGCSPSRLALTHTGMPNNFSVPAGWPATLIVQLSDDCGAPVLNGSVVANFSNNDAPLSLVGDRLTGTYSATWQPGRVAAPMTVTAFATAGALAPASAQLIGGVNPNQNPTPVLFKNGVGNNSYPVIGAALAPGTVSLVFGSGLASQTVSPGVVPLVTNFNGTNMLVGGLDAPLYYLSDSQLNVQIPFELAPNRQYQAIVSVNGALTLPETIDTAPVSPGVTAFPDGQLIAQHPDYTLVDTAHPAKPAEYLTMYLAGMGATNPGVASAQPAPGGPFATAAVQPTVTVDGQDAAISFAGLTPGGVGLYQINFQVPPTARAGTLEVVVMQGTVAANTTRMPVAP